MKTPRPFARLLQHPEAGQVLMRVEKDDEADRDKLMFIFSAAHLSDSVGFCSVGLSFREEDGPYLALETMSDEAALNYISTQLAELRRMTGGLL